MNLRKATSADQAEIWKILQFAIEQRRLDGSRQWQDGYPNPESIQGDVAQGIGYVLESDGEIACYCAALFNDEPAYEDIVGEWLTNGDFLVVHRVAVSERMKGKGKAEQLFLALEDLARNHRIGSIKVDTNFDNGAMLHILNKLGYTYCGEVFFRGSARKAFEKVL